MEAAVKMLRSVWLSANLGGIKMDESGSYDTSSNSVIADGELGIMLVDILWGMGVALSRPNAIDASDEWIKFESLVAELIRGRSGEGKHPPLLSRYKLCEQLEPYVLEKLGLVEQEKDLIQRAKKLNTREIFKQSKYNLLGEEPEGFAKLRVELGGGTVHNPEELQSRVRSLIGYFELDPNRCFDLTLEALEEDPSNSALLSLFSTFRVDSLPHLLGFKYSWYCSNEYKKALSAVGKSHRKPSTTPASLHRLTAYLLATGQLDLCSILPHLSPSLKEMGEDQKRFEAAESKKTMSNTRSSNPLAESEMNRRLSSSSTSQSNVGMENHPPADPITTTEESENQLIDLLVSLIEIKSWERVQELAGAIQSTGAEPARYRNVRLALIDLLEFMISSMFTSHADMTINYCSGKVEKQILTTVPDEVFKQARLERVIGKPAAAQLRSISNPRDNTVEADGVEDGEMGELSPATSFDTAVQVEMESTTSPLDVPGALKPISRLEEIPNAIEPILSILGPWLADNLTLFFKLCRLLKEAKVADNEGCIRLVTLYLFPALSLIPSNPLASCELWKVLKDYSLQRRINVYNYARGKLDGGASGGGTSSSGQRMTSTGSKMHYRIAAAEKVATTAIRDILKRLSRETTKENSRNIGKCLNSSPIVVMEILLSRLESYDNFIPPIVESLRYATLLAQDITSYLIVLCLDGKRPLFASTGLTLSPWLINISSFAGLFYKTYPGTTNYPGLLQFIEYSLREGGEKVNYVVVLKELLHQVGGVEAMEDISAVQLEGHAGGEKLRVETQNFGVVSVTSRRAARTLLSTLQSSKCVISLILLMAHQREVQLLLNQGAPSAPTLPLKILASQYDTLHCVLCQLLQFITTLTPLPKLFEMIPPIQSLVSTSLDESGFSLKQEVAIALWRPLLRQSLLYGRYALEKPTEPLAGGGAGKAVVSGDLLKEWDPYASHILPALAGGSSVGGLSDHLVVSFWSLTLYDIYVPKGKYIDEIQRLQRHQTECSKQAMDRRTPSDERERMQMEVKATGNLVNTLEAESNVQLAHVRSVRKQLSAVKSQLFVAAGESSSPLPVDSKNADIKFVEEIASDILQSMVYPRILMGAEDALFAAKFCFLLHSLRAPRFSFTIFMELCLRRLVRALFGSTNDQARSIAFFLKDILATLRRWSKDEKSFKTEAMNTLGLEELSHKDFVIKAKNWTNVLVDTLLVCLQSPEYQRVKCGLVVLVVVVDVYPWHRHEGELLEKELERMCEKRPDGTYSEQREDIRVKALSTLIVVRKQLPDMLVNPATAAAIAARQKQQQKQESALKSTATGTSAVSHSVLATHTVVHSAGTKQAAPVTRSGAITTPITTQHAANKVPVKPSSITQQAQVAAPSSIKHLPTNKSYASGDTTKDAPDGSLSTASSKSVEIPPTKRVKMSTSAGVLASGTTKESSEKLSILKKESPPPVKGNPAEIAATVNRTKRKVMDESKENHQQYSSSSTAGATAAHGGAQATLSTLRKVISTGSSAKQQPAQPPIQNSKDSSITTPPVPTKVISNTSSSKHPLPQPPKDFSGTLPAPRKILSTTSSSVKHSPTTQSSKDSPFGQGSDHDKQEAEMRQATRDALSKSKRASMPGSRNLDDEKAHKKVVCAKRGWVATAFNCCNIHASSQPVSSCHHLQAIFMEKQQSNEGQQPMSTRSQRYRHYTFLRILLLL